MQMQTAIPGYVSDQQGTITLILGLPSTDSHASTIESIA